jgi:hypothetical protein
MRYKRLTGAAGGVKYDSFFDNFKCFSSWCRVRGSSSGHGRRPGVEREPRRENAGCFTAAGKGGGHLAVTAA